MDHLHYRIVDVSTIKELVRRWDSEHAYERPPGGTAHRALDDIRGSIAELQYYRTRYF